jgi:hypothetical protein
MADKKISALTAATTPLAGTEVLPIVQSGATVKVAVSDLTAGRAISATAVTASTGNFIVGTSGQGIDFSATPGTGTSELLADYEEGTFTATLTPSTSGTITLGTSFNTAAYTKIGRCVTVTGQIIVDSVSSPVGSEVLLNLPFNVGTVTQRSTRFSGAMATGAFGVFSSTMFQGSEGNANVSVIINASTVIADTRFTFTFSYFS